MKFIVFLQSLFVLSVLALVAAVTRRKKNQRGPKIKSGFYGTCNSNDDCSSSQLKCRSNKCLRANGGQCNTPDECFSNYCELLKNQSSGKCATRGSD